MKDKTKIKLQIIDLINEIFVEKPIGDICDSIDVVYDVLQSSIVFITFIVELEKKFGVEISDNYLDMEHFRNIDDIVDIVCEMMKVKE